MFGNVLFKLQKRHGLGLRKDVISCQIPECGGRARF